MGMFLTVVIVGSLAILVTVFIYDKKI